ncbi:MAG: aspartate-semialdehyde dehydrogenase [Marinifilaceae bacterium]|jgi:aspartate-semialdehyde dehydrogenase|nr:aspartate-semialdehyde dehydrogenase [Marinifilaceae bacterium]
MKLAIVGVTGLVGSKIISLLEQRNFEIDEFIPVASENSVGKQVNFNSKPYSVVGVEKAIELKPDIAIFSAGSEASLKYAPLFASEGCYVIDNSSAWRMDETKKLVIPEINANLLSKDDRIIANPNCSTIQMLIALAPLQEKYGIERLVISTYQSITGTGIKAVKQMNNERNELDGEKAYPYQIDKNCIPQCDIFTENGYTKEEMKLVNETRKILNDNEIKITATAVRVPVVGGHSESINVELKTDYELSDIINIFQNTENLILLDDIQNNIYPMPIQANDKDEVFVGRLRKDFSCPKALNMWVVSDNLRKGAATNAVQIAEYIKANIL